MDEPLLGDEGQEMALYLKSAQIEEEKQIVKEGDMDFLRSKEGRNRARISPVMVWMNRSLLVSLLLIGFLAEGFFTAHVFKASALSTITNTSHTTSPGFDSCAAAPLSVMQAWWGASPYRWANIYVGGVNRGCTAAPDAGWVASVYNMGWGLVPTYVGLQAPYVSTSGYSCGPSNTSLAGMSSDPGTAFSQGKSEADDAISATKGMGINSGSIIYDDIEHYNDPDTPGTCDTAVINYVNGWVQELHAQGYKAGLYESASNIYVIQSANIVQPDDAWIAGGGCWSGSYNAGCTPYGNGFISDSAWSGHRLYQYTGGQTETWGGASWSIDSDAADGDIVGHGSSTTSLSNNLATGKDADGRLEAFARGADGNIWHNWQTQPNGSWNGWGALQNGYSFHGNPAVGTEADGRLDVFAQGSDGNIWHNWQTQPNGGWSGWSVVQNGYSFQGTPATGRDADGRLEVFARGSDGNIWHNWQTQPNGGWNGWAALETGFGFHGDPAVGIEADGRLDVFAQGADGNIWHNWQTQPNGGWSGWSAVQNGYSFQGTPAVSAEADGRLDVFARGSDGNIWHNWQTQPNGDWNGWAALQTGVGFHSNPAVDAEADGRLDVFAQGADGNVWHNWQTQPNGGWNGWSAVQNNYNFQGTPAVSAEADGRLDVFAMGADNNIWHNWQTQPNGGWNGWAALEAGFGFQQ